MRSRDNEAEAIFEVIKMTTPKDEKTSKYRSINYVNIKKKRYKEDKYSWHINVKLLKIKRYKASLQSSQRKFLPMDCFATSQQQ